MADNHTQIPGGSGTFGGGSGDGFSADSAISSGTVSFWGRGAGGQLGIYTWSSGSLARVADLTTIAPGTSSAFSFLNVQNTSPTTACFVGTNPTTGTGAYTGNSSSIARVVDGSTPVPGGTGNVSALYNAAVSDEGVALVAADSASKRGVYQSVGGSLSRRADTSTPIPGGSGNFTSFTRTSRLRAGALAFAGTGSGGQGGVFLNDGVTTSVVADTHTAMPGSAGNFGIAFGPEWSAAGTLAFLGVAPGNSSTQGAVFSYAGSLLGRLVGVGDSVTGTADVITSLLSFSADGNRVLFRARVNDTGDYGVYVRQPDGSVIPVVRPGDTLGGKLVDHVGSGQYSLSGDQAAVYVHYSGFDEAVVVFTVPAPSVALALTGAALIARRRRSVVYHPA